MSARLDHPMTTGFVNELIPKEDIKKYGIEEIDRRYFLLTRDPQWTVDRERNVYLGYMRADRDEAQWEFTCPDLFLIELVCFRN